MPDCQIAAFIPVVLDLTDAVSDPYHLGMVTAGNIIEFLIPNTDGKEIKLRDKLSEAHPLLIVFFQPSCPKSHLAFNHLLDVSESVGNRHILGIAQDSREHASRFKAGLNIKFEILYDDFPYINSEKFGFTTVPAMYWIDSKANVVKCQQGFSKKFVDEFLSVAKSVKGPFNFEIPEQKGPPTLVKSD